MFRFCFRTLAGTFFWTLATCLRLDEFVVGKKDQRGVALLDPHISMVLFWGRLRFFGVFEGRLSMELAYPGCRVVQARFRSLYLSAMWAELRSIQT